MPMGIVSDSEFESELNKPDTTSPPKVHVPVIIEDIQRGRTPGSVGVPDGLRKVIGDDAVTNGRQSALELAADFGISASAVSAYTKGATSTATYNDRPNEDTIKSARERITKKARSKLLMSLNKMTPETMPTKARELAGIAKDMSAVIRNIEPPAANVGENGGPTFVIYSPQFKKEEHYQTLVVKE
jgi:predicted transcriptional regulator